MAMNDESALSLTSKSGGLLSRMQAQAAAHAAQIVEPAPATPINLTPPPSAPASTTGLEAATTGSHEPSPKPSLEQPSSFVSAQARDPVPATITPVMIDTISLEPVSDLSEIGEPKGVPEMLVKSKKKSSAPKGKQNVTGQGSEGGPSKCKSGRKKAGNNA
ncbi:hypothetical protein J3R83DRAFT_2847 [Lanmaoa asiatica]|nr:hypothetical protein J3R83DRAFT_2847 [Lanmaoa asiatica]